MICCDYEGEERGENGEAEDRSAHLNLWYHRVCCLDNRLCSVPSDRLSDERVLLAES